MKKLLIASFALAVMITPLAGCSSSDSKDDCQDVAKKVCEKIRDCGYLNVSIDQCVATIMASVNQAGETDEQCRQEWDQIEPLTCSQFL